MASHWLFMLLMVPMTAGFAIFGKWIQRLEIEQAKRELADALKAKVEQLKQDQDARKDQTDAAMEKVDEAAALDRAKDPVAFANDLINAAGRDPITKG